MFKKLIIAVLTLGLLVTFSSAAISSDAPKVGINSVEKYNPNAPKLNKATAVERPAAFHKPSNALNPLTPTTVLPPDYKCEYIDYSGGAAAYFWRLTDKWGDTAQGMRFTPNEGYNCTLLTAYIGVYGTGIKGNPGMRVEVYDDDGFGFPGTLRGNVDVPAGNLPHSGMYYYPVDLSGLGLVYSNGAEFHIGVMAITPGGLGDTLTILSDDGSNGLLRSWEYYGAYGSMYDDWGADVNFLIGVDICCDRIPYTNCYTQYYECNTAYYWRQPDAYGDDYFNMRFTSLGPETLKSVDIAVYRPGSKPWGNPNLDVYVWGDLGGFPNLADEKAHVNIPWASLVFYPNWLNVDLSALNLVMQGDYHIGWSTDELAPGDTLACLSDDGSCGTGRSSENNGFDPWNTMLNDWGGDFNFLIDANLCKDEFSDCRTLSDFDGDGYYWRYPDRYGDISLHQLFQPKGQGCRIEQVNFRFYWRYNSSGDPIQTWPLYSTNSILQIYDVGTGGLPGNLLYSKTITPGNYGETVPTTASTRWWKGYNIHADNFRFDQPIWVGMESQAPDTLHGFFTLSDVGPGDYRSAEGWGSGFGFMIDDWGVDVDHGITLDVCCVPIGEWPCLVGEDWPTMGFNNLRQTHSPFGIGLTPECDLTKTWEYVSGQEALFNSPVIYKDTVLCYFLDRVEAVDINTGIMIWQKLSDGFVVGSGSYCTPTAYDGKLYIAGGNAKSFSAISIATGATVWTRNFSAHSGHFMTFGPSVVTDIGGTPYVIYADDFGWVYCVNANTGVLTPGVPWAVNPYKPGQPVARGLSTDGTKLYLGIDQAAASGRVEALDLATGAVVWANPGAGATIVPAKDWPGKEGFTSGIAVDPVEGVLYTNSYYIVADNHDPVQDGGVMYSINANTGATNWVNLCPGGSLSLSYDVPAIDASNVVRQGWTPWLTAGQLRGPQAFVRANGAYAWKFTEAAPIANPGWGDNTFMEGLLTCEPEAADWYVSQSRCNFLSFLNAETGAMLFNRRYTGYIGTTFSKAGHRVAPVMDDGHLIVTWRNKMFCLTATGIDRPRLELPNYVIQVPVEFGSPNPTIVTFNDAIRNTGCVPLTLDSINIYNEDNNTSPVLFTPLSSFSQERLNAANVIADKFTSKARLMYETVMDDPNLGKIADDMMNRNMSVNNAAGTIPAFVNAVVSPANGSSVAPGVTIPLKLSVNGPIISRGLHTFYAQIWTDDPDYFLDSARIDAGPYAAPQIQLGLIGGCLYGARRMEFGMTAAVNIENVWNSGMLANGDSSLSMRVDGDAASFWQGALIFAAGKYKVAFHSQPWDGSVWQWKSLLSDPDCISGLCPPQLASNVLLGTISTDNGATYTNVFGNVVTFAFVDSVQDLGEYDTTGGYHLVKWHWDWPQNYTADAPYDDTLTMGFHACAKVIGAKDVPALSKFTVHKYDLDSRNGVPIPNFYMGAMIDYDVLPNNKNQITGYDKAHSVAFVYDCGTPTTGWGAVKVPFGCRYESMLMAKTIEARPGGPWNDSAWWLDSVYNNWMVQQRGLTHQPNTYPCIPSTTDRDAWFTFEGATIPASGSITFGFGLFGLVGITDANDSSSYFGIANTINQWCGFGRGDVNNDGKINLADIAYLKNYVFGIGNGPYPFKHLGDVNADGVVDAADVTFLMNYYFNFGTCPMGAWTL
jgi:Dockerin type I domain/PQQ-like domain